MLTADVLGVDRGMWNVLYLFLNHKQFEELGRFLVQLEPSKLKSMGYVMLRSHILKGKSTGNDGFICKHPVFLGTSSQEIWKPYDAKNDMLGDAEQDNCLRFPKTIAAIQDRTSPPWGWQRSAVDRHPT